ncbi:MAG: FG-GAP repeat domain-containing protein [Gammaproteobacteria bacterium]
MNAARFAGAACVAAILGNTPQGAIGAGPEMARTELPVRDAAAFVIDAFEPGHGPEVIVASGSEVVRLSRSDAGEWLRTPIASGLAGIAAVATGDFDGDGRLDVAAAAKRSIQLLLQQSDAGFRQVPLPRIEGEVAVLASGDLNRDGRTDLCAAGSRSQCWLSAAGPDGSAFEVRAIDTDSSDVRLADLDGDGALDIAVATAQGVRIRAGDGKGGLGPVAAIAVRDARGLAAADFDNDGDADLVVRRGETGWGVLRNEGGMRFTQAAQGDGALAQPVDLDADGHLDIAAIQGRALTVAAGDGRGGFAPARALGPAAGARSVQWADVDRDGGIDAIVQDGAGVLGMMRAAPGRNAWLGVELRAARLDDARRAAVVAMRKDGSQVSRTADGRPGVFIGLGGLAQVDVLVAYWPGGRTTQLKPQSYRTYLTLSEPDLARPPVGNRTVGVPRRTYIDNQYECRPLPSDPRL